MQMQNLALAVVGLAISTSALAQGGGQPFNLRCSGEEPFWSVVADPEKATLFRPGEKASDFAGKASDLGWLRPGWHVWHGTAKDGAMLTLVARVEQCYSTMADPAEAPPGGYRVIAVLPGGAAVTGCCREGARSIHARPPAMSPAQRRSRTGS